MHSDLSFQTRTSVTRDRRNPDFSLRQYTLKSGDRPKQLLKQLEGPLRLAGITHEADDYGVID